MSEAIENTSIGRSHGRLTGPIFLRAVDQLHLLEFRSARSKDWPVNRRGRISKPDAEQFLAFLNELNVRLSEPSSYDGVFGLADQHGLTVYDAAYLDLAVHEGVPLASLDGQLIRAAQKVGVAFSALTLNREPCSIIRVFSAPHAEAQLRRIATTRYSHTPAARPGSAVSIPRGGGTLRSTAARLR